MNNQIEKIRRLKEQGKSIRDIADELLTTKYEVEKAFSQIKALDERPDSYPDTRLDDDSDSWPDSNTPMSRQMYSTPVPTPTPKSPKDLPSEWYSGVTRFEADFIVAAHVEEYETAEIKALYESKHPSSYMSLHDIRRVVQAYEQEETHQITLKATAKKANDEQVFRQFSNFAGEDALTFLLWVASVEEWEEGEMKSCIARAGTILSEIESFCRKHKFQYRHYEPYSIITSIKSTINTGLRKREEPEFDDNAFSFLEMLDQHPSLDRYFWKMLDLFQSNTF